jgi:hypothetical protein
MPESERLGTLALLQQNRQEVEAKLSALPITIETHSMVSGTANTARLGASEGSSWPFQLLYSIDASACRCCSHPAYSQGQRTTAWLLAGCQQAHHRAQQCCHTCQ